MEPTSNLSRSAFCVAMRLLVAGFLLGGAAAVPFDRAAQQKVLVAELKRKPRGLVRPERKYSVAELEELQRNKGARIEFLDDLSAAMATSPKFRQTHGLASFSTVPASSGGEVKEIPSPGDVKSTGDGSLPFPGMPGAKDPKIEHPPLPAGVNASEMEKAMSGGTPPSKENDGPLLPAGVNASEMEKAMSGGTPTGDAPAPAPAPASRADSTTSTGRADKSNEANAKSSQRLSLRGCAVFDSD